MTFQWFGTSSLGEQQGGLTLAGTRASTRARDQTYRCCILVLTVYLLRTQGDAPERAAGQHIQTCSYNQLWERMGREGAMATECHTISFGS